MNQTRSLPTKSPQSAGGDNTHINYWDPGWLGTSAWIQVWQAGWAEEGMGKLFLYQSQGQEQGLRGGFAGPSSSFSSDGCSSAWKGS